MDTVKLAEKLATEFGISLTVISYEYGKHFAHDTESRYIFKCKLSCNKKSYTFKFGQSISDGCNPPKLYNVLTCLQKYEVGTFENFCGEFGYNTDSRAAEKTYKAVLKEYNAMCRLFTAEQLEQLQEIW